MRSETVTRLRRFEAVDPYSQELELGSWEDAYEDDLTTLAPAEPRPSAEPGELARNSVTEGWTLYLPEGSDVVATDRMRVRGETYDVLGAPADWMGAGVVVQCGRSEAMEDA